MSLFTPFNGHLSLTFERGKNIADVETFGKNDPYVTVKIQKKTWKSKVHSNGGATPVWNQKEVFPLKNASNLDKDLIEIKVLDKNLMQSKLIGQVRLPVSVLLDNQTGFYEVYKLNPWDGKRSKSTGELLIRAEFKGTGGLPQANPLPSGSRNGLVSAWYGCGTARINVTGALQRSVVNGYLNFSANTDFTKLFLADPARGQPKTLTLEYLQDGKTMKEIVVDPPTSDKKVPVGQAKPAVKQAAAAKPAGGSVYASQSPPVVNYGQPSGVGGMMGGMMSAVQQQQMAMNMAMQQSLAQQQALLSQFSGGRSAPAARTMQVRVPPGVQSGALIQVRAPNGVLVQCRVPAGLGPGSLFAIRY